MRTGCPRAVRVGFQGDLRLLGEVVAFFHGFQDFLKPFDAQVDLIYGLPGQTMESWQDTVEKAAALAPEHLSCYGLKVEEGTPLWDMHQGSNISCCAGIPARAWRSWKFRTAGSPAPRDGFLSTGTCPPVGHRVETQGDILSENERIPARVRDIEYIMLGLRTAKGISRQEFEYRFRLPFAPVQAVLARCEGSGHAVLRGGRP